MRMKYQDLILFLFCVCDFVSHLNCQQSVCAYENNIDYLTSTDLTYGISASAQICCSQCSVTPGCVGFTYVSASKNCFLKSSITQGSRTTVFGRISGTITSVYTTYPTSTYSYFPVFTTAPWTIYSTYPVFTTTTTRKPTTARTTTTPTKAAHICSLYQNVFLNGNDLSQVYVPTAQTCCNYCGNTPSCKTWSFVKSYGLCMMKNSLPSSGQLTNTTNAISGLLVS